MKSPEPVPEQTNSNVASWRAELKAILTGTKRSIALVGVGHPLRGDDFVGSYAVKAVIKKVNGTLAESTYLFDAEDNVETSIIRLAELAPDFVIFIDACEMGAASGETRLIHIRETSYPFFTTHGIPLRVLADRLLPDSEVWVLAIQPKRTEFGDALSPEVRHAASSISGFIVNLLEARFGS